VKQSVVTNINYFESNYYEATKNRKRNRKETEVEGGDSLA
jgi:hypothetical protein